MSDGRGKHTLWRDLPDRALRWRAWHSPLDRRRCGATARPRAGRTPGGIRLTPASGVGFDGTGSGPFRFLAKATSLPCVDSAPGFSDLPEAHGGGRPIRDIQRGQA